MFGVTRGYRFLWKTPLLRCVIEVSEVYALDPFSKTRVVQFLKRSHASKGDEKGLFRCERIETKSGADEKGSFVCRLKLFDDAALGEVEAVGIASNPQNAELAAAMHAERLIDSTGRCLYALAGMQRRHAAEVASQGRWAPKDDKDTSSAVKSRENLPRPLWAYPGGGGKSTEGAAAVRLEFSRVGAPAAAPTASAAVRAVPPKPSKSGIKSPEELEKMPNIERRRYLRRIAERAPASARSRVDETEGNRFQLCNTNTHRIPLNKSILLTPTIIDSNCIERVRKWYELVTRGGTLDGALSNPQPAELDGQVTYTVQADLAPAMLSYVAAYVSGASSKPTGPVIACGKASTVERATILLGMHAELLLDHWGIYVDAQADEEAKKTRRQSLVDFGRGFGTVDLGRPAPLPLKELSALFNEFQVGALRHCALSAEEKFVRYHGEAFNYAKSLVEVNAVDDGFSIPGFDTMSEAKDALFDFMRLCRMRAGFLLTTDCSDTFRCTLVLNNWDRAVELSAAGISAIAPSAAEGPDISDIVNPTNTSHPAYVALGTGPTQEVAENLCVMHAIELLTRHNIKLFPLDEEKQKLFCTARRKLQLYAPTAYGISPPPQKRLLHKSRCQGSVFSPHMALSGPSFFHSYRRNSAPPPFEEERQIRLLSPLHDFSPIDEETMSQFVALYTNRIQEYLGETRQRVPDKLIKARQNKFVPHVIVQEQGSSWRHRSTAWFHVRVPSGRSYRTVTAIGQAIRVKEAERACFVHLVLLLRHNGIALFDHADKIKQEQELFQALKRPLLDQLRKSVLWKADTLRDGYSDTTIRVEVDPLCPPVIWADQLRKLLAHREAFEKLYEQLKTHGEAVDIGTEDTEDGDDSDENGDDGGEGTAEPSHHDKSV